MASAATIATRIAAMTLLVMAVMLIPSLMVKAHQETSRTNSNVCNLSESAIPPDEIGDKAVTKCQNDDKITMTAADRGRPKFFFPAQQETLTDDTEMEAVNRTLDLLYRDYPFESSQSSISHHHFVKMASKEIQETLKRFVWNPRLIQRCFKNKDGSEEKKNEESFVSSYHDLSGYHLYRDPFDEIYWMRPEFDLLDQDKVHYDEVLKTTTLSQTFPFCYFLNHDENPHQRHIFTVRSLTYLNSGPPAEFVALTSGRSFNTSAGVMVAMDFNQELHYAKMRDPNNLLPKEPRIMIKAAVHLFPADTPGWVIRLYIALHRSFFFVIKNLRNVFESHQKGGKHKSEDGLWSQFSGSVFMALDNLMRSLNKIHIALPCLLVILPVSILVRKSLKDWKFVLPFILHISLVIYYNICPSMAMYLRGTVALLSWAQKYHSSLQLSTSDNLGQSSNFGNLGLLFSWCGICWYLEQGADMANRILMTPLPDPIILE